MSPAPTSSGAEGASAAAKPAAAATGDTKPAAKTKAAGLVDGDTPKPKTALSALSALTGSAAHVLVVIGKDDRVSRLSLRNVPGVHVLAQAQLNTRDVLVSDHVVFTAEALDSFVARSTVRQEDGRQ